MHLPFFPLIYSILINSFLLDLIFPKICLGCSRHGQYLCPRCLSRIHSLPLRPPSPQFEGQLSLFKYQSLIRTVILELKFKFITDLVDELSKLVVATLVQNYPNIIDYWQDHHFAIIPIPLHSRRQNWRGFNQSELLAEKITSYFGLNLYSDCLLRPVLTPPQVSLRDKSLRLKNPQDTFRLASPAPLNVILFDDVFTTGSTLLSAASAFPPTTKIWSLTIAG